MRSPAANSRSASLPDEYAYSAVASVTGSYAGGGGMAGAAGGGGGTARVGAGDFSEGTRVGSGGLTSAEGAGMMGFVLTGAHFFGAGTGVVVVLDGAVGRRAVICERVEAVMSPDSWRNSSSYLRGVSGDV